MARQRLRDAAVALAVAAALVGSPQPHAEGTAPAAEALERGDGSVSVIRVAQWIRDRRPDLSLLDLRSREAFEAFHLPTSRRASLAELLADPPAFAGTVVLVGDGGPLAAQAWVLLSGPGREVHYLDGGVEAWLTTLLNPVLPSDATPEERVAWSEVAEVSIYFGGMPVEGGPREDGAPPAWFTPATPAAQARVDALVESARRQGCGF